MSKASFTPAHMMAHHEHFLRTGEFDSVVPEVTDIHINPAILAGIIGEVGVGGFGQEAQAAHKAKKADFSQNLLKDKAFRFHDDYVSVTTPATANDKEIFTTNRIAGLLKPIDQHFREWAGIPKEMSTTPWAVLNVGKFKPVKIRRGIDYHGSYPLVSYRVFFQGKPEHSPVYYPAPYGPQGKIIRGVGNAMVGPHGMDFKFREPLLHPPKPHLPTGVVTMEPWNAMHSDSTERSAIGSDLGMLTVQYNLQGMQFPQVEIPRQPDIPVQAQDAQQYHYPQAG